MQIVRFEVDKRVAYGVIKNNVIEALSCSPFQNLDSLGSLDASLTGETYPVHKVILLAPCEPSKIIGVGLNFAVTANAMNMEIPKTPLLFLKPSTAVVGSQQDVILQKELTKVICEGELAVVIGKKAKSIIEEDAASHILGFTLANDVMDFLAYESDGGNPTRSKIQDTFAPIGPCIETDLDLQDLSITTYLNGQQVQYGEINNMIFSVNHCLSYISSLMTLLPGDVITMGAPSMPVVTQPGDLVEVVVDKIGTLRNRVVATS